MRIAYCGNFRFPWCTEVHLALTMEEMGHEVIRIQEDEATLVDVVERANACDIFYWTRTIGMMKFDGNAMLEAIKVPTISLHLDLYWGLQRESTLANDPFWHTDFVFQPDNDNLDRFKAMGVNAYWSPPAVYAGECNLETRPLTHELIFVGSVNEYHNAEYPFRREMISSVSMAYPQLELYPKQEAIRGQALNELYQSTKVVVGDSLTLPGNTTYTSDRIFETTGRGGFILYPDIEWLTSIFPKEIFYEQRNLASLEEKIGYYLQHDEEREALREQCYEITKRDHCYTNRLEEVMKVINGVA